jgi:hypothetical protein
MQKYPGHEELLLDVFDKNLKAGVAATMLNQIVPQTMSIKKFSVALGSSL